VQRGKSKSKLDGFAAGSADAPISATARHVRARAAARTTGRGGDNEGGAFGRLDTDFHLGDEDDLGLGFGYHSIGDRGYVGRAEYKHLGELWNIGFGADRSLRFDSLVALAGDRIGTREFGSARENRLHFLVQYEGERATITFMPYGGVVDAKARR
jgi:hypothetical protein